MSPRLPLILLLIFLLSPALSQPELAKKMQQFIHWVGGMEKAQLRRISIRDLGLENGGLGIFATSPIPKDTVFLSFPTINMINAQIVEGVDDLADFFDMYPASETNKLVLFLLYERFVHPSSHWKPYLDILPTSFSTPLYFSPEELNALKGSPLFEFAERRKATLKAKFEEIEDALENYAPNLFAEGIFTQENFNWAFSTISSRLMTIGAKTKKGESKKFSCLVPLVDLMNTGYPDEINTACRTSKDSSFVECVALVDIPTGTELLVSYSQTGLSNSEYLLDYGFALEENEKDSLTIPLPQLEVEAKNLKEDLIKRLDAKAIAALRQETDELKYISLNWKTSIPSMSGFMAFMRILLLEPSELSPENIERTKDLIDNLRPVNNQNEKSVADKLISHLKSFLKKYPTTLKQDEATLDRLYEENTIEKRNLKNAVIARVAEKRLIENHIHLLREYRKKFDGEEEFEDDEYRTNPSWSKLEL